MKVLSEHDRVFVHTNDLLGENDTNTCISL